MILARSRLALVKTVLAAAIAELCIAVSPPVMTSHDHITPLMTCHDSPEDRGLGLCVLRLWALCPVAALGEAQGQVVT